MALRLLLILASLALSCEARRRMAASWLIGGATSFGTYAPPGVPTGLAGKLLANECKKFLPAGQTYQSVGSGTGVANLISGTYVIALSDIPLDAGQDKSLPTKYTFALALAKYTFFVNGKADYVVKMTAAQTYNAFFSGTTNYAGFTKVVPFSRGESSGTTSVVKRYWAKSGFAQAAAIIGPKPFPGSWYTSKFTKPGSGDVCAAVAASTAPAITYSQVGICNQVAPGKTGEVQLMSKAGVWVTIATASAAQAIPIALPIPSKTYSGVPDAMILATGKFTPPMVSFIYGISRSANTALGKLGSSAKSMLSCINTNINKYAKSLQFDLVPDAVLKINAQNIALMKP